MNATGFGAAEVSALVNATVVEAHVDDAAFLWGLRRRALRAPHYKLKHLAALDARLHAHLAGLLVAGDTGSLLATRALERDDASTVFVLAYLGFASPDMDAGQVAMRVASQVATRVSTRVHVQADCHSRQAGDAFIDALSWHDPAHVRTLLARFDASPEPWLRRAALAAQLANGDVPERVIARALDDADADVRALALRAVGQCKCRALLPALYRCANDVGAGVDTDAAGACRFWSAWSLALLGDADGVARLWDAAANDAALARPRLELAMRAGPTDWARAQVRALAKVSTLRQAINAAGALGDPAVVPWLFDLMLEPDWARVAAEAFCTMTGADLELLGFKRDPPDDAPADPPTDAPADTPADREFAEDDELYWPDVDALKDWWCRLRPQFGEGQRLVAGQPASAAAAIGVLRGGYQRQRRGAALELARWRDDAPVFAVDARADRQQRRLLA